MFSRTSRLAIVIAISAALPITSFAASPGAIGNLFDVVQKTFKGENIQDGGVTSVKLSTNSVTASKIADGQVGASKVNTSQIQKRIQSSGCSFGVWRIREDGGVDCSVPDPSNGAPCTPTTSCAAQGKTCGTINNGCATVSCGTCGSGQTCNAGTCQSTCTPSCTGKSCGTDGCGGSCGSCASNQTCTGGLCQTTLAKIDGVCGVADNTCVSGNPDNFDGTSTPPMKVFWDCKGINGGVTAGCANCMNGKPIANNCQDVVCTDTCASLGYTSGVHTICGAAVDCTPAPPPVNGVCGSANGSVFTFAPSTNLCSAGTASSVTGVGPWEWTCNGQNGGDSVTCNALKKVVLPKCICTYHLEDYSNCASGVWWDCNDGNSGGCDGSAPICESGCVDDCVAPNNIAWCPAVGGGVKCYSGYPNGWKKPGDFGCQDMPSLYAGCDLK